MEFRSINMTISVQISTTKGSLEPIIGHIYFSKHAVSEARRPNSWRAGLRIKRSGFESWPDPEHRGVFWSKTLYSNSSSLHPVYKWAPANLLLGVAL